MKHPSFLSTLSALFLCAPLWAVDTDYLGAELYSKETFKYGRFEARMLMASGNGLVSSMFTYYDSSYLATKPWREIDIEVLGKAPDSLQSNIITRAANVKDKTMSEQHHAVSPATNSTYHTYAIEWTPDSVAWYVDGVQVRKTSDAQTADLRDQKQSLRFNLWISSITSWVGDFSPAILPVYQYINWVKYYAYTPGSGTDGANFTLSWEDDFDTFPSARWGAGNWTFDDNLVTFTEQNMVVKQDAAQENYLVLCLTTTAKPGFSGTVPADDGSVVGVRPASRPVAVSNARPVRWYDLLGKARKVR